MRNIILSVLLIAVSLGGLAVTIRRFDWLQRRVPFLLYWGRWPVPRFRASKIGVAAGFTVSTILGILALYSQFLEPSRGLLGGALCVVLLIVIIAGTHDFILDRRVKGQQHAARNSRRAGQLTGL